MKFSVNWLAALAGGIEIAPRQLGNLITLKTAEQESVEEIGAQFPGEPGRFVADLFAQARKGRIWYAFNPDEMATALGQERRRVVRALEVLEERGLVELRAADVRQRYARLRDREDADALAADPTGTRPSLVGGGLT